MMYGSRVCLSNHFAFECLNSTDDVQMLAFSLMFALIAATQASAASTSNCPAAIGQADSENEGEMAKIRLHGQATKVFLHRITIEKSAEKKIKDVENGITDEPYADAFLCLAWMAANKRVAQRIESWRANARIDAQGDDLYLTYDTESGGYDPDINLYTKVHLKYSEKVDQFKIVGRHEGDAFQDYLGEIKALTEAVPTLDPANRVAVLGNYTGYVPPGMVLGATGYFTVTFKGPSSLAGG